eukprot:7495827-Pyramimonas_sp.AAC.1
MRSLRSTFSLDPRENQILGNLGLRALRRMLMRRGHTRCPPRTRGFGVCTRGGAGPHQLAEGGAGVPHEEVSGDHHAHVQQRHLSVFHWQSELRLEVVDAAPRSTGTTLKP